MLDKKLEACKFAQRELNQLTSKQRNQCLKAISNALIFHKDEILKSNEIDIKSAKEASMQASMIERLTLNEKRIEDLAKSILDLILLNDVVGETIEEIERPNGLKIEKIRVPFGVVCVIFESRPNVCVDIACLCIKTSNACVLKGGKEAIVTNKTLVQIMREAISPYVNQDCITLIESTDRSVTSELITKREYIDVLIPRGGKTLIDFVISNAKIPYIETGAGNCHLYVHKDADLSMALEIAINAKHQRPSVCNSIENILIDEEVAPIFLQKFYNKCKELGIEMRGCSKTLQYIQVIPATEEDFYKEYNSDIIAIKVVSSLEEAILHINMHSSKHSEAIITENEEVCLKFFNEIDSACVYHNASTRFTDGGEFGFGAEIGISTQKLHARGPMGLKELCSYKYKIYGSGQVRK